MRGITTPVPILASARPQAPSPPRLKCNAPRRSRPGQRRNNSEATKPLQGKVRRVSNRSQSLRRATRLFLSLLILALAGLTTPAEQIPVIHRLGALQGLLLLKDKKGSVIAIGDQTQVADGNEIHARLIFRFRDGSIDDETTVYRQGSDFQLIRDHHIQEGRSFPHPVDITIDVPAGEVTWVETSGKQKQSKSQHMKLPPDLANGMIALLVEDYPRNTPQLKVSYLVPGSKPRVIGLTVKPEGTDKVLVGWSSRHVAQFDVHFDIGGLAGVLAHVIGKQPPDLHLWALGGSIPQFVKMEGQLYRNGPIWTMTQTAPTWPAENAGD